MRIVFAEDAERAVATMDAWWREHRRDAPDLFEQELGDALMRIEAAPSAPPVYTSTRQGLVRRVFLPKTRNHIYYVHVADQRVVRIIAVWGGIRGTGPPLR